jgi:muramoyltetrapeptide carboxypeptidase
VTQSPYVGVWTPSAPAPALFPARTERALAALQNALGRKIRLSRSFDAISRASAAEPATLADELHELVSDPRCELVMASTGGWTSSLILPFLDLELLRTRGVPLVGYSDVSTLLWAIHATGGRAIHGPMLLSEFGHQFGPFDQTVTSLTAALDGGPSRLTPPERYSEDNPWWDRDDQRELATRTAPPWRVLRHGRARGPALVGCLMAVQMLFGTPYFPRVDGSILILEDFGIAPDHFLGLLSQWVQSGSLNGVRAIAFGRRSRPGTAPGGYADFDDAVLHVLDDLEVPVVVNVDIGHTEPQLSIELGREVVLDTRPLSINIL